MGLLIRKSHRKGEVYNNEKDIVMLQLKFSSAEKSKILIPLKYICKTVKFYTIAGGNIANH
jgi:hypothetical protein